MEFRAEYSSNIASAAKTDAQAVRALRTELEAANKALGESAKASGPSAGPAAAGGASGGKGNPAKAFDSDEFKLGVLRTKVRREQEEKALQQLGMGLSQAEKDAEAKRAAGAKEAASKREKAEKADADKAKEQAKAKKATRDRLLGAGVGLAAGAAGLALAGGRAAIGAVGQAAGVNGVADLARLAMGIRGMATLQALSMRTQLQVRQMFKGVDSSPAVRAADRFLNSIFNGSTAAGKALKGIIDRNGNDIMKALERGQPAATAFFQALIVGALQAEKSYLELAIATDPILDSIEDLLAPANELAGAMGINTSGFELFGMAVKSVIDPLTATTRLLGTLVDLSGRADASLSAMVGGKDLRSQMKALDASDASGPAGEKTGAEYVAGLLRGAEAGAGKVDAAGRNLGIGLDKGVRAATETHSPSKVAFRTGEEYPEGYALGVKSGAPKVEAAVEKMAPGGGVGAGGGPASRGAQASLSVTNYITVQGAGSDMATTLQAVADRVFDDRLRTLLVSLGFSPALSAGGGAPS